MIKLTNAYKTGLSLEWFLNNPELVEGGQEHLDSLIKAKEEPIIEMYLTDTSCMDYYNLPVTEELDCDFNLAYQEGYRSGHKEGDEVDGMIFVGTLPGISEELELQAENGELEYYHNGPSFFEVWVKPEFYKGA